MKCGAWIIKVPEPTSSAFPARLKAQEDYLGSHLAPWLLDAPPASLGDCHSFHFMRYIDATHAGHGGISLELRVLGAAQAVQKAAAEVEAEFARQKAAGFILTFEPKAVADWQAGDDYGGNALSEPFAELLAASTRLALQLLKEPRRDFGARNAVVANWAHCVRLVASGMG